MVVDRGRYRGRSVAVSSHTIDTRLASVVLLWAVAATFLWVRADNETVAVCKDVRELYLAANSGSGLKAVTEVYDQITAAALSCGLLKPE